MCCLDIPFITRAITLQETEGTDRGGDTLVAQGHLDSSSVRSSVMAILHYMSAFFISLFIETTAPVLGVCAGKENERKTEKPYISGPFPCST